jgi:hypothetical protein
MLEFKQLIPRTYLTLPFCYAFNKFLCFDVCSTTLQKVCAATQLRVATQDSGTPVLRGYGALLIRLQRNLPFEIWKKWHFRVFCNVEPHFSPKCVVADGSREDAAHFKNRSEWSSCTAARSRHISDSSRALSLTDLTAATTASVCRSS